MSRIKIAFSHPLLSLSVKKFLTSYLENKHDIVTDDNQNSSDTVDILLTDYTSLTSQHLPSRFPHAQIILIDTGLTKQQKRISVSYFKVRGIISNKISLDIFQKAIASVKDGDFWLDHETSEELVTFYTNRTSNKKIKSLTKREQEIIPLVCKGFSNKEIAQRMGISVPTVKALLTKVFRKFDVYSRYELFVNARESGILEQLGNHLNES